MYWQILRWPRLKSAWPLVDCCLPQPAKTMQLTTKKKMTMGRSTTRMGKTMMTNWTAANCCLIYWRTSANCGRF
jgi:hypothetical protein